MNILSCHYRPWLVLILLFLQPMLNASLAFLENFGTLFFASRAHLKYASLL